jgi:hypothetical protein
MKMLSPDEIKKRASRQYEYFLKNWLVNAAFQALDFRIGDTKDFSELRDASHLLREKSKENIGYGYQLIWENKQKRDLGNQTLPIRAIIDNSDDFLQLLSKQAEFKRFQADVSLIRQIIPSLENWLCVRPMRVIEYHGLWNDLLKVCTYFLAQLNLNLYIRELPIDVHSKFIEENATILRELLDYLLPSECINRDSTRFELRYGLKYDEPSIRLRLLDAKFKSLFAASLDDIAAPVSQVVKLNLDVRNVLIVENKITFLTLPQIRDTVAIWGKGFQVELLVDIGWLKDTQIYYWGDLDAQGFQILSALRSNFPHTTSFLMDLQTFEKYQRFVVRGTTSPLVELTHLSPDEFSLYQNLAAETLRLEQERISQGDVLAALWELGLS